MYARGTRVTLNVVPIPIIIGVIERDIPDGLEYNWPLDLVMDRSYTLTANFELNRAYNGVPEYWLRKLWMD